MLVQLKNMKLYLMLLIDASLFAMAFVSAYLLRFEFELEAVYIGQIKSILPFLLPTKLIVFFFLGLYKGMWRYSSIEDSWRLGQASFLSMLLLITFVYYFLHPTSFPRSIFLMDAVLTFLLTGGIRMGIRSYYSATTTSKGVSAFSLPRIGSTEKNPVTRRVLIIGAGNSGEKILREILENPQLKYTVACFLDDDPGKRGRALHGVPVLGPVDTLLEVLPKFGIKEVFISVPNASGIEMRRIVEICEESEVPYKTLPAIGEIIDGNISISALRKVNYDDLLRRSPVQLDMSGIQEYLSDRTVLVTGAGGSIGSELCRQVIRFNPRRLILLDSSEENLFNIHMEFRDELGFKGYHCVLGSVQDYCLMEDVYQRYHPEVVFHAAAYKHVPLLERNPWEAIFNNVRGSKVTMDLALKYGVGRFVLISTDKAVEPSNVMGTTKRLTELMLQSLQHGSTRFMVVRFGNVVGSSGSVVRVFQNQIEKGGPITLTHPEMTRYFMTIPEASQLILQAGAIGEGGEIFVLEMGDPVKIVDIAKDLIRLSGKKPGEIKIVITGLRPGEKMHEELITKEEDIIPTKHKKITMLRANGNSRWNGHGSREAFARWLDQGLGALYQAAERHDADGIKRQLKEIVEEYSPQKTETVL